MCGKHLLCRKTVFIVYNNWFRFQLWMCLLRLWMATEKRVCENGNRWNTRPIVWDVPLLIWSLHFARRFIYFISFVCSLCAHGNNLNELVLSSLRELYWGGCIFMVPCQMYLTVLLFIVWLLDEHFAENVLRAHVFRFGVGLHSPSFSSGLSIILACTGNNNRATTNKIYNICMLVLK